VIFFASADVIAKGVAFVKFANIESESEDDAKTFARAYLGAEAAGKVFHKNNDMAWPTAQLRRQDGKLEARKRTSGAPEWGPWEAVR
jgi:hypothetical protein